MPFVSELFQKERRLIKLYRDLLCHIGVPGAIGPEGPQGKIFFYFKSFFQFFEPPIRKWSNNDTICIFKVKMDYLALGFPAKMEQTVSQGE